MDARRRARLVANLGRRVESGRLTAEEADRLRAASEPDEFETVVRLIRVRHAGTRLAGAVEDGSVSREAADAFLDRLRTGEHSRAIRGHLRWLLAEGRSRSRRDVRADSDKGEDDSPA